MGHITWFDAYAPGDEPQLGGKNASLGVMTAAGLPVPPGFAITCCRIPQSARQHTGWPSP